MGRGYLTASENDSYEVGTEAQGNAFDEVISQNKRDDAARHPSTTTKSMDFHTIKWWLEEKLKVIN